MHSLERIVALLDVRPSVRLSVSLGWTCIVIIRCTLSRILVYGCIV